MCKRLIKRNRFEYFEIRYEDLCQDQDAELTRVYEHLGLNPDSIYGEDSPDIHIYGNSKVRKGKNTNIVLKPDTRWEEELSSSEIDYIKKKLNLIYSL